MRRTHAGTGYVGITAKLAATYRKLNRRRERVDARRQLQDRCRGKRTCPRQGRGEHRPRAAVGARLGHLDDDFAVAFPAVSARGRRRARSSRPRRPRTAFGFIQQLRPEGQHRAPARQPRCGRRGRDVARSQVEPLVVSVGRGRVRTEKVEAERAFELAVALPPSLVEEWHETEAVAGHAGDRDVGRDAGRRGCVTCSRVVNQRRALRFLDEVSFLPVTRAQLAGHVAEVEVQRSYCGTPTRAVTSLWTTSLRRVLRQSLRVPRGIAAPAGGTNPPRWRRPRDPAFAIEADASESAMTSRPIIRRRAGHPHRTQRSRFRRPARTSQSDRECEGQNIQVNVGCVSVPMVTARAGNGRHTNGAERFIVNDGDRRVRIDREDVRPFPSRKTSRAAFSVREQIDERDRPRAILSESPEARPSQPVTTSAEPEIALMRPHEAAEEVCRSPPQQDRDKPGGDSPRQLRDTDRSRAQRRNHPEEAYSPTPSANTDSPQAVTNGHNTPQPVLQQLLEIITDISARRRQRCDHAHEF